MSLSLSLSLPRSQVHPLLAASILLARTLHNLASPGGVPVVPLKVWERRCERCEWCEGMHL